MKCLLMGLLLPLFLLPQKKYYTVGEVLKNARQLTYDSVTVKIKGYITGKVGRSTYLLEDRTAEIRVDIADRFLPGKPFNDKDEVIIEAWVQYEINKPVTLTANRPVTHD
ncbi:NirD/YgiW/YdeI family stress tolerance protein [Chitinophaga qingshengii]|uniref:NirD/YgiW/YdeI family stress tolerance protein n=1 Tax=Chitinophaga qingshengii TaxID=1569794 RepID=A0ABR7THC8_9BACT|nr:NirD/YgiW/YdeI family stress tolerance protein [Chitinophaga qingshengii]MBC9929343.1 NirD/YgiW/YdeI family stress tolerance protein [Chitinophaga qingshengii]